MKNWILITLLLAITAQAKCQTPDFYRDGLNVVNSPVPLYQPKGHTQIMYAPGDFNLLPPSGQINKIYFRTFAFEPGGGATYDTITISFRQTTDVQFNDSTFYTNLTTGLYSTQFIIYQNYISNDGWIGFALPSPFTYDNTKTLIVDIKYPSKAGFLNSWCDSSLNYKVLSSTSLSATQGTLSKRFNYFGIDVVSSSACTGPPTPGIATATRNGICGGSNYLLDLVGNSSGAGQTYRWQKASAASGPYTNIGPSASYSYYAMTAAPNTWYRAAVTCDTFTTYSTPIRLTVNSWLPAGTYTINSNLPTGGTNFKSFKSAVDAMTCGIAGPIEFQVVSNSGVYYERVLMPIIPNASAANTIKFHGNGNTLRYKVFAQPLNVVASVWEINGTRQVTVDSLTIDTDGGAGLGVWMTDSTNNITFHHCRFERASVKLSLRYELPPPPYPQPLPQPPPSYSDSVTIQHNTFINGSVILRSGFPYYFPTSNYPMTRGCTITDNTFSSGYVGFDYLEAPKIERNVFNNGGAVSVGPGIGASIRQNTFPNGGKIQLTSTAYAAFFGGSSEAAIVENQMINGGEIIASNYAGARTIISKNSIIDTTALGTLRKGISLRGDGFKVWNNLICLANGSTTVGINAYNVSNASIANNTISLKGNNVPVTGFDYDASSTDTGVAFLNNLIDVSGTSVNGSHVAVRIRANPNLLRLDYNNYNSTQYVVFLDAGGVPAQQYYASLAAWQASYLQDAHSQSIPPQFISYASGNFRPNALNLDNKGIPVAGITDDITNIARNTITPDIGAYEFGVLSCPPPTNLVVSGITTSTANFAWTMPSGSNDFQYIIDQQTGAPVVAGANITGSTLNAAGLLPYTNYYFHLRTNCSGLFSVWVTIPFTTLCSPPSAVITTSGPTTFCSGSIAVLSAVTGPNLTYQWKRDGVIIPGATNATYTANVAGNYTVTVGLGTCSSSTQNPITILAAPTITYAGATTFCQGGSVALSTPMVAGYTYQWLINGSMIAGANNATYLATSTGAYRVVVNNGICSDTAAALTITVLPQPPNTVTPPGPVTFCDRQAVRLNAALNATYTYQWRRNGNPISGATSAYYDATLSGNYTVVIGNGFCSTTTNTVEVNVDPLPTATADAVGNTIFCNNGSVNIQANPGVGLSYQWLRNGQIIPGATARNYLANLEGLFSVVVANAHCSDTSLSVSVVFNAYPRPVITYNNGLLTTTTPFATYQWNKNGLSIPFANSRDYTPIAPGNYVAVVGDTAGCLGSSNVITIKTLGVGTAGTSEVKIYPNPATDIVYIETGEPAVNASVLAADGRTVLSQTCAGQLNIGALPAGIYSLKVMTLTGSLLKIEKLVKVR